MQGEEGIPANSDPMIGEIVAYWRSLHQASMLPDRRSLDPIDFPRHLPGIALLDAERDPWRFRFRLLGDEIILHHGANFTGQWMHEIFPHFPGTQTEIDMITTAETEAPVYRIGKPLMTYEKSFVEIERVMLPFRSGGEDVGLIFIYSLLR